MHSEHNQRERRQFRQIGHLISQVVYLLSPRPQLQFDDYAAIGFLVLARHND